MDNDFSRFNGDGTLLRQHQLRMLEMLVYIDSICKANNIPYWLSSGTLLGAVRHGGFIPWDDDVDIEMLREDYLKLSEILEKETKYSFQSRHTDKFYAYPYAKLRDKQSEIKEHGVDAKYKFKGIYIDIFVMEYSHYIISKLFSVITWQLLAFGSKIKSKSGEMMFLVLKRVLYGLISTARFVGKFIPGKKMRHTLGFGFATKLRCKEKIFPLKEVEFEKLHFLAPADTDYYLKQCFGDYMKLPDLDRLSPHVTDVKLW